ncbi:MAG: SIMPL domain-containing protein [Azonexus sp.]|uniref:SIMPL domain-containing protein n=1 Tax=Azonexus sp. TaxID=1872668 RepID=UPI0028314018|nr:SIMPL domain-containing protein [Azonexus sp.]MDR0777505.1 SIMPL domain-containing protein [Azonexus sp.]
MNNPVNRCNTILAALLLAAGIATAGYFVGRTMYNANVGINTAEAKGLAERRVEADRALWKIQYSVSGPGSAQVARLYEKSEADQAQIVQLLLDSGFDKAEISPGVIDYRKEEYRGDNQKLVEEKHILVGSIDVETSKVRLVAEVRAKLNKLIAQGLDIQNNAPAYHFTKLNEIKPEMVKEATTNARIAANEFATNAGVKVGGIRYAQQGGFVVHDIGEEYGDSKSLEKEVRLVTTITFYLD